MSRILVSWVIEKKKMRSIQKKIHKRQMRPGEKSDKLGGKV